MASSSAAWVFGGVRLISSARIICAKIGPCTKRNEREPWSSSRISVPVMSAGIRSGVNWIRLKLRSRICAIVLTSSVFANPGTPVIRQWPPQNIAINTSSTTSSCPTITLRSSVRIFRRLLATFSARPSTAAPVVCMWLRLSSVSQGINHFVDQHLVGLRGPLQVTGILLRVRPLNAVAHVGVPVNQHHWAALVIEDAAQMRREAALLPGAPAQERSETGNLRILVDAVETRVDRMRRRNLHDLAIRKHPLQLLFRQLPFVRAVKIVKRQRAAAQQELAQNRHLGVLQLQVAGLDNVDPGIVPELWILECQDDWLADVDRGDGLDAP